MTKIRGANLGLVALTLVVGPATALHACATPDRQPSAWSTDHVAPTGAPGPGRVVVIAVEGRESTAIGRAGTRVTTSDDRGQDIAFEVLGRNGGGVQFVVADSGDRSCLQQLQLPYDNGLTIADCRADDDRQRFAISVAAPAGYHITGGVAETAQDFLVEDGARTVAFVTMPDEPATRWTFVDHGPVSTVPPARSSHREPRSATAAP